jgi:hypothetical protein
VPGSASAAVASVENLILTRSAYDHKRVRPLEPGWGVVKSLELIGLGPVGLLVCLHNAGIKYKKPPRPIRVHRRGPRR